MNETLEALAAEVKSLKADMGARAEEQKKTEATILDLKTKVENLEKALTEAKAGVEEFAKANADAKAKIEEQAKELATQKTAIEEQAKNIRSGDEKVLAALGKVGIRADENAGGKSKPDGKDKVESVKDVAAKFDMQAHALFGDAK